MLFGINEIFDSCIFNKDYSECSEYTRRKIVFKKKINPLVIKYLVESFSNLRIEIGRKASGNIMDLKNQRLLEGWCWQTTESAIVFLDDEDYISRGYLQLNKEKAYYHSWICFTFQGEEYIFDACLNILAKKDIFDKVFQVRIKGTVKALDVKNELKDYLTKPRKEKTGSDLTYDNILRKFMGEEEYLRQREEVTVKGNDDVNSPMYRNLTGYKAEIEDGKIKKLTAHFYDHD